MAITILSALFICGLFIWIFASEQLWANVLYGVIILSPSIFLLIFSWIAGTGKASDMYKYYACERAREKRRERLMERGKEAKGNSLLGMPVRDNHMYRNVDNVGMHINVFNRFDGMQVAGGTDFCGSYFGFAGREYPGAINMEIRTGVITEVYIPFLPGMLKNPVYALGSLWENFDSFFLQNHKSMHTNIEIWQRYIEPLIKGDIAHLVDNLSETCL